MWNELLHNPYRCSAFMSTTARLLPDPEGKIKSNFGRGGECEESRKGLSFGSSSSSGIILDHWRRVRGPPVSNDIGPGYYQPSTRDRFGNLIAGKVGEFPKKNRDPFAPNQTGGIDKFHTPPRNHGTAAFATRTHRKLPPGRRSGTQGASRGTEGVPSSRGSSQGSSKGMNWTI